MKTETQHRIEQLKKATDRIQREIEEVTEREHELRSVGSIKTLSHDLVDSKVRRMPQALSCGRLKRTTSTPQILEPPTPTLTAYSAPVQTPITPLAPKMTNGVISTTRSTPQALRFVNTPSQKGLMHRFLATRGRIYNRSLNCGANGQDSAVTITPIITLNPDSIKALNRSLETRSVENGDRERPPTRKGFVPVEKKIQKELTEMKERENELRLMRSKMLAKSQPNLIDLVNDNDSDVYDSAGSLRSGTSTNTLNEDEPENKDSHKPPRRRSNLIAQWESLIAKEANEKTC